MNLTDLLLFSGAVYGAAWVIACSKLCEPIRTKLQNVWFIGPLLQCVVCVSAWVALALACALPHLTLYSVQFRSRTLADIPVLVAWSVATSWAIAVALKDAD